MEAAAGKSSFYPNGSVFNVVRWDGEDRFPKGRVGHGPGKPEPDQSFDIAIIEFAEDGGFVDQGQQLTAATKLIKGARKGNPNGVLVVLFIHGWHHGAAWDYESSAKDWNAGPGPNDDKNLHSFRYLLMSLAVRESERGRSKLRRVIGIYLGWNGDPKSGLLGILSRIEPLNVITFGDRYDEAVAVGRGQAMQDTLRRVVDATKAPMAGKPESLLVLSGHSMGALVLETALLSLLRDRNEPMFKPLGEANPTMNYRTGVKVCLDGKRVMAPDLILTINAAAKHEIIENIETELQKIRLRKWLESVEGISYAPPLLISVTSEKDTATDIWFWLGTLGDHTEGWSNQLLTHTVEQGTIESCSKNKAGPDFGQDWHCLRHPRPLASVAPTIPIDLPTTTRTSTMEPIHHRFNLIPSSGQANLVWIFRVKEALIKDHNAIFEPITVLLFMAMMQVSGAIMSLAEDIDSNFE